MRILYLLSSSNLWGARKSFLEILKFINREKFTPFTILPRPGPLENELAKIQVEYRIIHLPPWRKWNRWRKRRKALKELLSFLKENNFSLIHANSHFVTPYAIKTGKLLGLPVITHIRALLTPDKIRKYLIQKSDLIICNSLASSKVFPPHLQQKVKVIYNGIDTNHYKPAPSEKVREFRKSLGISDEPILGYLGKISREKGVDILLEILPELKKEGIKILVGGEVRRERDKDLETTLKNSGAILLGNVDNTPLFYSSIDILFFPTRIESFGRVAVESLSCKTPVVASRVGGVKEIVEEEKTGYLFSPENPREALEKILILANNPQKRKEMGERGREVVMEKFEIREKVKEIEEIYTWILTM